MSPLIELGSLLANTRTLLHPHLPHHHPSSPLIFLWPPSLSKPWFPSIKAWSSTSFLKFKTTSRWSQPLWSGMHPAWHPTSRWSQLLSRKRSWIHPAWLSLWPPWKARQPTHAKIKTMLKQRPFLTTAKLCLCQNLGAASSNPVQTRQDTIDVDCVLGMIEKGSNDLLLLPG
jgi:hypothetical protein